MDISSTELIEGILSHNIDVINMLYHNHYPMITSYVINNSGTEENAKDIYQDALIVLYEKLKLDTPPELDVLAYLTTVCKNLWLLKLRKRKKEKNLRPTIVEGNLMEEVLNDIQKSSELELYRYHFNKLGQKCQAVLKMFFEKKTMKEIASVIKTTEQYAKKSKYKCQKNLIENIRSDKKFLELTDQK